MARVRGRKGCGKEEVANVRKEQVVSRVPELCGPLLFVRVWALPLTNQEKHTFTEAFDDLQHLIWAISSELRSTLYYIR